MTAYEIGLLCIQELKGANTVAKQLGNKPTTSWPRGDPISLSAAGPEHVVAECGYRSPIVSAPLYSHAPGVICAVISLSGVAEGIVDIAAWEAIDFSAWVLSGFKVVPRHVGWTS